ncbi:MAG: hypothetical protein AB7G62_13080 [Magnetospirillum sp.]
MLMERTMTRGATKSSISDDRRLNPRHDGAGLKVEIEGQVYPVVNISTGGLCLIGLNRKVGERFRFVMSRVGEVEAVTGEVQVLDIKGSLFHLVFTRPTMPLMRMVIAHVSALTGITPHLLKSR